MHDVDIFKSCKLLKMEVLFSMYCLNYIYNCFIENERKNRDRENCEAEF